MLLSELSGLATELSRDESVGPGRRNLPFALQLAQVGAYLAASGIVESLIQLRVYRLEQVVNSAAAVLDEAQYLRLAVQPVLDELLNLCAGLLDDRPVTGADNA